MSGADNSMIKPYQVTEQAKRAMEAKVGDMTLRDYFAGQALTGIVQRGYTTKDAVERAYRIADAMIKAREL